MISTSDFKKGVRILVDGDPYAVEDYSVQTPSARGAATLVRCTLDTGRTHQIRVHLAAIGHPLVGDPVYGTRRMAPGVPAFARQALHAQRLAFVHPVTRRAMSFASPLPADFAALLDAMRAASKRP